MGSWDEIVRDYNERMEYEKKMGIDKEKEVLMKAIGGLSLEDVDEFIEEGTVPPSILKVCDVNPETFDLMSKNYKDIKIGSLNDIIEQFEKLKNEEVDFIDE